MDHDNKREDFEPRKMNTKELLQWINKVIIESKKPEVIQLREKDKWLYMDMMVNKFKEFYTSYPNVFAMACLNMTEDNKKRLGKFLAMRELIDKGKISKMKGEYLLGEELAQTFAPGLLDKNRQMPE